MVLDHLRRKITGLRREEVAHNVETVNVVGKINGQTLGLEDFFSRWENKKKLSLRGMKAKINFHKPHNTVHSDWILLR